MCEGKDILVVLSTRCFNLPDEECSTPNNLLSVTPLLRCLVAFLSGIAVSASIFPLILGDHSDSPATSLLKVPQSVLSSQPSFEDLSQACSVSAMTTEEEYMWRMR